MIDRSIKQKPSRRRSTERCDEAENLSRCNAGGLLREGRDRRQAVPTGPLRSAGVVVEVEAQLRKSLEREAQDNAVLFDAAVVADDGANGGDPAREVAVNRVTLLLEDVSGLFVARIA